ncbi:Gyp5p [Saccharomyces cerevisiae x Saccharomyces kudriavzevii VIN7]|uniref:GTPase-activating protein GYP5 n=3 Tax=Saccharomyces TaxID=4930 RepID=H0H1R1_SACCK|nr:Gyp5p [Saccharomyces cerevisiae x Saccharomyces kudriavzevii VIN7]
MSSNESMKNHTDIVTSELDEAHELSNRLVSDEKEIETMALIQTETETTNEGSDDISDGIVKFQKVAVNDTYTSNSSEREKSQSETLPSKCIDSSQPKHEIVTTGTLTDNAYSKAESNDNQLDLRHGVKETHVNVSADHIAPFVDATEAPTIEQKAEKQNQETEVSNFKIDSNEQLDFVKKTKDDARNSNELDIKNKNKSTVDDEEGCSNRKVAGEIPLDNKQQTGDTIDAEDLLSGKLPSNEPVAVMVEHIENEIPVPDETLLNSLSQGDNQIDTTARPDTEIHLNEIAKRQDGIEDECITVHKNSSDAIRKLPPIPMSIPNGMGENSGQEEVSRASISTSPPLPPRQNVAVSTSSKMPSRGKLREEPSQKKNAVPPPLDEEMKSEKFRKNLEETRKNSHHRVCLTSSKAVQLDSTAEINLIASRYRKTSIHLNKEGEETRESLQEGQSFLKSTYTSFLENLPEYDEVEHVNEGEREIYKIDWSFWTQVVNDFATVASNEPEKLEAHVTNGIPPQIRGILWQLMANSKSREMEDIYETLLDTECLHEATIRRDLRRTKFVGEDKMESLFKVIKVYSVYDPDVGYTQGMAFIAAPLLMNCENEAESFGLMVGLMKNYGLRELFLPGMPGLMLMLYQFDRLLEEHSPNLYNRLIREGISSTMYATQWFLTVFAYKFPLEFVLRIFDIVFVEGIEVLLKFAVNIMLKNEESLVKLRFDELLEFLKDELFNYYLVGNHDNSSVAQKELPEGAPLKGDEASSLSYNVDLFVHDAMRGVYITPLTLRRYRGEYIEIHEKEQKKENHYESLRIQNHQLQREAQKLEHDYSILNEENISAANELIENRLNMEMLLDEKNDLTNTIADIKNQIDEEIREQNLPNPDASLPRADLKEDLERTVSRNNEVMRENGQLEERISQLQAEIDELMSINKEQASTASLLESGARGKGKKGWTGFKKVFK